jgi:hypothetical protein
MLVPLAHRRRIYLALIVCLVLPACSNKEPFTPPDLLYLFATYTVGKNPTSVATGDFDEDGITDIVTTNIGNDSISILFGIGDGTFKEQKQIPVAKEPRAMALADFNGDGRMDLAIACSGSDQIALYFGLANGNFIAGPRYDVHKTPVSIAAGDFNGDRKPDLAIALRNDKIKIFTGQGDGTFVDGPQYEYGDTPTSIAVADLDRNGTLDLAVTNGGPMSSAVSIWMGNGDGSFRSPTDYRTGKRPLVVTFADFNDDRFADLLVMNGEMDSFTIFLGNGNGTFQPGKESGADAGPVYGLARDIDGDGRMDAAIVNVQSNNLSILYGRGDGTFRYPPMNYRTRGGPFALAMLNLTAKSTEEPGLVMANNGAASITIFLHRGLRPSASPAHAPS